MSIVTDIVFLDLPSIKACSTSPNTWKVRLALNYKKLNYRTQWVSDGSIESVCRSYGIPPTAVKPDGNPHYTLPALVDRTDASNPIFISDSMPIVEYLEKAYPAAPGYELFPSNTKAFQNLFVQSVLGKLFPTFTPNLTITSVLLAKPAESQPGFRQRMEARFGKPFDTIESQGAEREASFKALEETFGTLSIALNKNAEGRFLMGHQVSFSDFALAGWLILFKTVSPDEVWARIISLDGGRWEKYLDGFQEWMAVDK